MSIINHEQAATTGRRVCVLAWSVYEQDARIRKYSEALAARGSLVDVICLSPPNRARIPNRYCLHGVNITEIGRRIQEKGHLSYLSSLLKFWMKSFCILSFLCFRKRYDLVHVHSIPDFEVFAAFPARLMGAKVILDIHDPMPEFYAAKFGYQQHHLIQWLILLGERISTTFADHVITVTHYWRDVIAARSSLPSSKISVIMNLPDTRLFEIAKYTRPSSRNSDFTILYPGTMNKHCGVGVAVEAVGIARKNIPNITLNIYGKGSEARAIRSLVERLNLRDAVFFHEPVPWESVPELMAQADAGIALLSGTGIYSEEALNVKIFEFLAMGVPAIVTHAKSTERYLHESTVMFSRPNDPEDVARAILEIYSNGTRKDELIRNGLEYIRHSNWQSEMGHFFKIVENLTSVNQPFKQVHLEQPVPINKYAYKFYYRMKSATPRSLQLSLRRQWCTRRRVRYNNIWPVDPRASEKPQDWKGWPGQKRFALVLTHDVESQTGQERSRDLMALDRGLGFQSSFNFVAEDYPIQPMLMNLLTANGCEIGIHGLHHNGSMYTNQQDFNRYANRINQYLERWNAVGFRSPSMHHNLEWIHEINLLYDSSTFDTDPFEPQPDGAQTIFPFWVQHPERATGYVELPYTLAQDFTLFTLLKESSIDIWKRKLDWIVEHGGMALLVTHPDYMSWNKAKRNGEEYPVTYYKQLLEYILERYKDAYWNPLPKEIARFWIQRYAPPKPTLTDTPKQP